MSLCSLRLRQLTGPQSTRSRFELRLVGRGSLSTGDSGHNSGHGYLKSSTSPPKTAFAFARFQSDDSPRPRIIIIDIPVLPPPSPLYSTYLRRKSKAQISHHLLVLFFCSLLFSKKIPARSLAASIMKKNIEQTRIDQVLKDAAVRASLVSVKEMKRIFNRLLETRYSTIPCIMISFPKIPVPSFSLWVVGSNFWETKILFPSGVL
jgi:hypothetical protein